MPHIVLMAAPLDYVDFWAKWDKHVQTGDDASRLISTATDENLVALVSTPAIGERESDREAVAVELLERLAKRHTDLPSGALDVLRSARAAYSAAIQGQRPIKAAQAILQAEGEPALGKSVSASASSSLATTKLAYEAAQEHADDVRATQAQSRVTETLTQDAAVTASVGSEVMRDLGAHMKASGHQKEGKAADDAAQTITDAANASTRLARRERHKAEGRLIPPDVRENQ